MGSTWIRTELERVAFLHASAPLWAGYLDDEFDDRSAVRNVEAVETTDLRWRLKEFMGGDLRIQRGQEVYRNFQVRLGSIIEPKEQLLTATAIREIQWVSRIAYPIEGQRIQEVDGTAAADIEAVQQYLSDGNNRDQGYPTGFTHNQRVQLVSFGGSDVEVDDPHLLIVRLTFTSVVEVDRIVP